MSKNTSLLVLVGIVVVIGGYLLFISNIRTKETSLWATYENATYQYKLKYPPAWYVGKVQEEEKAVIGESREIVIGHSGGRGVVGVTTWDPSEFTGTDHASIEFRQSININLKSFAEVAYQKEVNDKNPNFPNKEVSELQESVFAGQKAFSYIVRGSMDGYGSGDDMYLFLENNGVKFKIYYSLDVSLPKEIASTFEFTNSSITAPVED